jgi:hypothetical protein
MNNKLIFLIVVLALLFGLIFVISKNRTAREKVLIEEKIRLGRQQFVHDSLQKRSGNIDLENLSTNKSGRSIQTPNEDFSSYINASIINSSDKTDIAVTVVDENGNISSSISNSIANIYNQRGNTGNTGLLQSSFVHKSGFQELFEGNSEIIEKLNLSSHTDYIALGTIQYSIRKGTLVDGTVVCTTSLTMNIISSSKKSIVKSFSYSENGNGVTEPQAKEAATEKLINKYYNEHSSL